MRSVFIAVLGLAGAGCTFLTPRTDPIPMRASDSAEYAGLAGDGQLELRGQAFLTSPSGEVKLAAGREVTLDPATAYARAWFRRFGADSGAFEAEPPDPRFAAARRTTTADARGRFRFSGLGAGTYLVRSLVTWQEREDSVRQGGVVAALVTVGPGEPAEAVVSRQYTQDSAAVLVVEILADAELGGRSYRSLGWFTGVTCDTRSEEAARKDLVLKAGWKGADAVGRVECRRLGVSLKYNCMGRIECVGEGIGWG